MPVVDRVRAALAARARAVWGRDRASLGWLPALGNRLARVAILVGRGIVVHRLGLLAAALTYFTVFAIVPTLAVILWILRALDWLPTITPDLPAQARITSGNELIRVVLHRILEAVHQTSQVTSGVVGLLALLFAVSKMFSYTERALHIIAASGQRTPKLWRMLGYVALLLMPLALVLLWGLFIATLSGKFGRVLARVLEAVPGSELLAGGLLALGALWLAVTIFYSSGVRARIPFSSAAVGAAVAAIALPVVSWVFANFQIGVSQSGSLHSGILAFPVFLLWVYSSWSAVLVGAEIAVAHRVDRVLVHGAATFRLDAVGERQVGAAIMLRAAAAATAGNGAPRAVAEDDLARELRVPPGPVGELGLRLCARGLLREEGSGFALDCDPDRTTLASVMDAIERDPALEPAHLEAMAGLPPDARAALSAGPGPRPATSGAGGLTLRQLADEQRARVS
jgi:membrane protein